MTDIDNQQVRDDAAKMKNYCGVTGSINAESFKRNLARYIDDKMKVYSELEDVIFDRK